MLSSMCALKGGLRVVHPEVLRAFWPTLRQARCYGFGSHMSDNSDEILEKEKQRHLQGKTVSHIKQVPGWNERLASDAEAVVKAEKECPDCPVDEMQQQTIDILREEEEQDRSAIHTEPMSGTGTGTAP